MGEVVSVSEWDLLVAARQNTALSNEILRLEARIAELEQENEALKRLPPGEDALKIIRNNLTTAKDES
jgi:hypothetical protein